MITMDGREHYIPKWDIIIAHPPCTYLTVTTNRTHSTKRNSMDQIAEATALRIDAMRFFMRFVTCDCERVAIENPVGVMSTVYRQPDQIIQPWMFCDGPDSKEYVTKTTCLWLKGLPPLKQTNALDAPQPGARGKYSSGKNRVWGLECNTAKERSKTFLGIARAMADQWGSLSS